MLNALRSFLNLIIVSLGITPAKYVWMWCGEPGWPRWDLEFDSEGFSFRAVLAPDLNRPSFVGRFVTFAGPDTVSLDGKTFYIPARLPSLVKEELIDSGMTPTQAEKQWRRVVQKEMLVTDSFDRGYVKTYSVNIVVKRGRSELASTSCGEILMDPALLILGGETHVTDIVLAERQMLISAALSNLKQMAAPVIHFS